MDEEGVNCWICIGIPQHGGEEQVNVISTAAKLFTRILSNS